MKIRSVSNVSFSCATKNKNNMLNKNLGKIFGFTTGSLFTTGLGINAYKNGEFDDLINFFKKNPSASKLPAIGSCIITAAAIVLPFFCIGAIFDKIANNKNKNQNNFVKQA